MPASSIERLTSNTPVRTELIPILHSIATDLAKWLHGQFLRHGGKKWWENHVCGIVHEKDEWRIADGQWKQLEDMDLAALLNVLQANFRFLVSHGALGKDARDPIRAMRDARNRCEGHWPVNGISLEEMVIHMDALRKFGRLIGGAKGRLEEVNALAAKLEQLRLSGLTALPTNHLVSISAEKVISPLDGKQLVDFFGDAELTPSQKNAVAALQHFLDAPDEQCFVLKGYAGTGKTFLIGGLVRYLHHIHRRPEMMAPTGRAAHVLRERHQVEATTIHRHIYSLTSLKDYRELDENGDITFKFFFELKNNDAEHDTVFIVDEASMISDVYSESEFMHFGSGRLLPDLLRYINFDGNDYRKKLILVGDDAQLPPVGMNTSPALDQNHLNKKCLVRSSGCELTDVVRQMESSPILENATRMREMLRSDKFPSFDFAADGVVIRELTPDQFVETFVQERDRSSFNRSVIVAYTNEVTKAYNQAVRNKLFPGKESITAGDQIIVVRNNYNYERALLNGQMGLVVATANETESRNVPLNVGLDEFGKRKTEVIKLEFRDATLSFVDDRGGFFEVTCKISEDCLLNGLANLPSLYSKALYVDFGMRHPHLKPSHPEFKETLKSDPYFNAVMMKFGYAITCHKSQGGEWHTVFVDFTGKNKLNADGIRWSYTALTRAESRIVATNALHHHILKPKRPSAQPAEILVTKPVADGNELVALSAGETAQADGVISKPAHVSSSTAIRQLVEQRLPEKWKIATIRSLSYQERFVFSVGQLLATASIYYKSNNKISKIQILPVEGQDEIDQQAADFLNPLKGQLLFSGQEATPAVRLIHKPFVEGLKSKLELSEINLVALKSITEFHLVACLRIGNIEGSVDYWFDGKGALSTYTPHPTCPESLVQKIHAVHA